MTRLTLQLRAKTDAPELKSEGITQSLNSKLRLNLDLPPNKLQSVFNRMQIYFSKYHDTHLTTMLLYARLYIGKQDRVKDRV